MSNLRSDCRDLVKDMPAGDTFKVHIEALCHQIDTIEECWHAAERKARDNETLLSLWRWMATMGCNVWRNSAIGQPDWAVVDVDRELVAYGYSPEDAIRQARVRIEGEDWEERERKPKQGKGGA